MNLYFGTMSVNIEYLVRTSPILTACQFWRAARTRCVILRKITHCKITARRTQWFAHSSTKNHKSHYHQAITTTTPITGFLLIKFSHNPIKTWLHQWTTNLAGSVGRGFSPAFELTEEDLLVTLDELQRWHNLAKYKYDVLWRCLFLIHFISFEWLYTNELGDGFFPTYIWNKRGRPACSRWAATMTIAGYVRIRRTYYVGF
jgi:hypothetical protein